MTALLLGLLLVAVIAAIVVWRTQPGSRDLSRASETKLKLYFKFFLACFGYVFAGFILPTLPRLWEGRALSSDVGTEGFLIIATLLATASTLIHAVMVLIADRLKLVRRVGPALFLYLLFPTLWFILALAKVWIGAVPGWVVFLLPSLLIVTAVAAAERLKKRKDRANSI